MILIIYNLLQKTEAEGILPNSLYKANIILTTKLDKDTTRESRNQYILGTDAKSLNKILGN
jgi:hypothetical protein